MLTIHKKQVEVGDLRGASAAARYSLELADGPLAVRGDDATRANTVWMGTPGALRWVGVELGTAVRFTHLRAALQGRHALTGEQVRRPGTVEVRDSDGTTHRKQVVNSYDMTFSAPKSVSAAWAAAVVAGDTELADAIEQAMIDAAHAAVEHHVRTRPVISGKEPGKGWAGAAALHVLARTAHGETVPSPQLHVHVDLVGVLDDAGNLRTPNGGAMYKNSAARESGAVGRAVLADRMERLGFELEAGTGRGERYFELAGVARELRERFSGRTRDVLRWIKERQARMGGQVSQREAARAGALTRKGKARIPRQVLLAAWGEQFREFGFGAARIATLRRWRRPVRDHDALAARLREQVLRHMWEEGPSVSVGAVQAMAYEFAPHGLSLVQAAGVLRAMQAKGELIALEGGRVTTPEVRGMERRIRDVAIAAGRRADGTLSRQAVRAGIATAQRSLGGTALMPDQRQAVERLTTGAGWMCLTGPPGTGKGPVLEAVAEAHRQEGWNVVATAVDGATTQRLGAQVRARALTLEQLLRRVERGSVRLDERTLVIVEEASKVGLRHWDALARLCADTKMRVLCVGDVMQIGAIECAGMLDVMLEHPDVPGAKLEKRLRFRDPLDKDELHPWLVDYHTHLYEGRAAEAIVLLRAHDAITLHETRVESMVAMVDAWEQARADHRLDARDTMLIVYGSNADVDEVNVLAQDRRLAAGELGTEGVQASDRDYLLRANDVVMLREAAYQPAPSREDPDPGRVENGTMGVVERVDLERQCAWVAFDEPLGTRSVRVELGALRAERELLPAQQKVASLRLCYGGLPFPMQGATFKYVGALWGHHKQLMEETVSADARGKHWLDVHLDRETAGRDGTEDEVYARMAERLSEPRHQRASITWEESPDVEVAELVAAPGVAPRLPARPVDTPAVEAEQRLDPLAGYRELLGPELLDGIEQRAAELAERAATLADDDLEAAAVRGREAWGRLDRPAAREARRLARDRLLAAAQIDGAHQQAAELEAQAETMLGYRARRERRELLEEARTQLRIAGREEEVLATLDARDRQLRADGRHPTQWLAAEHETVARWLAAEHELGARRAPEIPLQDRGPDPARERVPARDAGPELGG